jgi:hypothetical protein
MSSNVSTKKVGVAKKKKKRNYGGRPKSPHADKIRCWHRYDQPTLDKLTEVREAMCGDVPFFFHGHIDDSSVIAALIHKAHHEVQKKTFDVNDYILVAAPTAK